MLEDLSPNRVSSIFQQNKMSSMHNIHFLSDVIDDMAGQESLKQAIID